MTDNMRIWSKVDRTDPDHTKKVNQRGGFTAIDAHYQIMSATNAFGPVGEGWGYDCGEPIFHGDFIVVPVTLWHGSRENYYGPIYGCAQFLGSRPDADAPKKAMTDALTKGLSHLGFNADVFLGKFDDNRYVAELREGKARKTTAKNTDPEREHAAATEADALCKSLSSAKDEAELATIWDVEAAARKRIFDAAPAQYDRVKKAASDRKHQLTQKEAA